MAFTEFDGELDGEQPGYVEFDGELDEPKKDLGLLGTLKEGAKGTVRNLGAAVDTAQGDEANVVSSAKDAANAEKDPALSALLSDIGRRKKALGDDPSWLDSIGTVGKAAMANPKGAGLLLAEQLPNSAAALGAGAVGAAAGSMFGPAGTVIGGIAGLFGANTALETGGKAIDAAGDGSFTPEEQGRVMKEGAIKGGVITGVDAATLGMTNFIMGTTRRAVERATVKTLTDSGVDVTNKAAVLAASKSPEISQAVKAAQDTAQKASTTLGKNLAKVGGATALETVGEGAGEYLGEYAATGKADKVDAVIEAFSSLGQSAGEIAFTAARNKAKMATIAGKPVNELSDGVLKYTANRGSESAKKAAETEIKRRTDEGADPSVRNAPETATDAVDRIISTGKDKAAEISGTQQEAPDAIQDSVFDEEPTPQSAPDAPTPEPVETLNAQMDALEEGRKPGMLLTPGEAMPETLPEGVQSAVIPDRGTLLYRDDATLQAALQGRMGEALGYGIDEKPETDNVVTVRDANGTVIQDVATDGSPKVEQAAAAVAGKDGTVEVRPVHEALAERTSSQKEPWQMAGSEWRRANDLLMADNAQSILTKASGSQAVYRHKERERLRYGVSDDASKKMKAAQRGEIKLSAEELETLTDRLETRVNHKDVIEKALKEGKSIPAEVLAEYPDLSSTESAPTIKPLTNKQIDHRKRLSRKARERRFINSSDTLNQAIIKLGGIHPSLRLDLTGDAKGNTRLPFVGALFSKKGTQDLSDLANQLQSHGYFTEEEVNSVDGGAALLAERIRSEYNGAEAHKSFNADDADELLQKHYEDMEYQAQQEAKDRGLTFDSFAQPEDLELHGESPNAKNLVDAELVAKAIAIDADQADAIAEEFGDDPAAFMRAIEQLVKDGKNEGIQIDEDREANIDTAEGVQANASEEDIFGLETQSEAELKEAASDKEKTDKEAKKKSDAEEKARKAATEKKEIEQRGKNAADDFVLGGSAIDELAGQKDIFSQQPKKEAPAKNEPAPKESTNSHPVRPLVESLIKRRAAARQGGKNLSTAIDRAKEVMEGKRTDAKVESRYFRLQAKAFENADPVAAKLLGQIAESIKDNAPKLSRTETKQSGLSVPEVEKHIAPLQQAGFKKINVAATQNDLPQKVKEQIKSKNAGNVRGVYLPSTDEIWLVADQLNDATESVMVALHEARHRGLRKMFGSGVDPVMRQIYATNKRVRDSADRMMKSDKDMSKEEAIEEVLADMPIDQAKALNGWKRLVRFIKQWITEKLDLAFTDEMVEQLVAGAEVSGLNEAQTDTPAFKKWFKGSKVVDENGKPLVVYHGTRSDFNTFRADRGGLFFTVSPHTASAYAFRYGPSKLDGEFDKLREELKAEGVGMWDLIKHPKWKQLQERSRIDGANVAPVYLSINNPFILDGKHEADEANAIKDDTKKIDELKAQGYDGILVRDALDRPISHNQEDADLSANRADIWIAFDQTQIKSATGNNGNFDANNPDIRFSRKPGSIASWDAPEPSKIDNLIYSLQNKHVDLKRVMESIRDTGTQLAEKFDAYLQEELFHGRAAKRTKDFVNSELKPLIAGLKLRGLSIDELDKYLHARHAQEANALILQRDPKMPDGSGMTDKAAQDYLTNLAPEKKRKLDQAAKKVDDIITGTRDLYFSYGLIDQATYNSWGTMFKHYVPLMREDKDGGMGMGQGFSIKGKEAKHRTGSTRAVVDILANIALQREKVIVRGEKNRVAVSLAGLAKLNPNPDFWTFDKAPTDRVLVPKKNTYEVHYHGSKVMEFTSPVEANKFITFQGDPAYTMNKVVIPEHIEERADPMFKNRDNVVVAKIKDSKGNVIERAVIFNEDNERAMRMAKAIKNLDATQLEGLMGVSAKITRYFAAINTQYNPVFGVVNLTRDLQASLINLSSTPIAGHKAEVLKNVWPAIRAIYSSSRSERKGNQSTSAMSALWEEMQKEGGMTGYRDLFKTSEDRANAIKRELDPTAWMNSKLGKVFTAGGALKVPLAVAQKQAGWIFDLLSDYNQTLEGAMRLSVYKVAIDKGLSKPRAASIAKNISVNFNRRGSSGQQAGALYAFFNAAMQGTARIGETMTSMDKGDIKTLKFNRTGKQIIVGGITLGAVQALALAAAGFDDDEPPEFIRERNLIIPFGALIGTKQYVTIPMPLGFHAIPNIGRISTEFAMSGFKKPAERTAQLFMIFAEAFNPIGTSSTLSQTVSPTVSDPLVALGENKDWTGKPIAKEDFNKLSPTPGFSRNKDTASDPAKWIAEAINTISGGNKYVPGMFSPTADQIDYLAGQVTGGVGREAGKIQQSASAAMTGEELPPHKMPLIGRFYGNSDNSSSQGNAFYANLKRINEIDAELTGRRKDRLPTDQFKAENPEHRLVVRGDFVQNLVSKQRKKKSELLEKDAPKAEVKAVEERITKLMTGFNNKVKELKEEARQ
jgi:conjugative element/phage-associated large polyvalent protein/ADP-ribosyltransferase-like protein